MIVFFIILFVYLLIYILLTILLYIIIFHRFEIFVDDSIQLAVQPVLNGWTSKPMNRWPHQFDVRSGPSNYAMNTLFVAICLVGQLLLTGT